MSLEAKLDAAAACLRAIAAEHPDVVLANSYGAEDMVLTDLIARLGLPIAAFSLDTGRLPAETYDLMQRVEERYPSHPVTVYFPQAAAVEHYVKLHGINGFYQSVDQRKSCCQVRKLEPLRRALAGRSAWITGLRRGNHRRVRTCRSAPTTPTMACRSSARCWTGASAMSGTTCARKRCLTTLCTTVTIPPLAARPVLGRSRWARMSAPGAGGGKTLNPKSAACTRPAP